MINDKMTKQNARNKKLTGKLILLLGIIILTDVLDFFSSLIRF